MYEFIKNETLKNYCIENKLILSGLQEQWIRYHMKNKDKNISEFPELMRSFILLPYPYKRGDIVKLSTGEYGTILEDDYFYRMYHKGAKNEPLNYDNYIPVDVLSKTEIVYTGNFHLLSIEKIELTDIESESIRNVIHYLQNVTLGKSSIGSFINTFNWYKEEL